MKRHYFVAVVEYSHPCFSGLTACVCDFEEEANMLSCLPNLKEQVVRKLYPMPSKRRAMVVAEEANRAFKESGKYLVTK